MRASWLISLWIVDLALLIAAVYAPSLGIDIYLHDTYYVIALPHLILATWLLLTIPLIAVSVRRIKRRQRV